MSISDSVFDEARATHARALGELKAALEDPATLKFHFNSRAKPVVGRYVINLQSPHFPRTGGSIDDVWRVAQLWVDIDTREPAISYHAHESHREEVMIESVAIGYEFLHIMGDQDKAMLMSILISGRKKS